MAETGWLKQKKLFFSYFWGPEVQDQVNQVGAGFLQSLSPWLVDGPLLPVFLRGHPSVCVLISSAETVLFDQGPP